MTHINDNYDKKFYYIVDANPLKQNAQHSKNIFKVILTKIKWSHNIYLKHFHSRIDIQILR